MSALAWKRVEDITSGDKLARFTIRGGRFSPTLAAIQHNDDGARGIVLVTIGDRGRTTIHMRVGGTNISRTYYDDDQLAVESLNMRDDTLTTARSSRDTETQPESEAS